MQENLITDVHEGLYGETNMRFTGELPLDSIDCLFFCTAHGDTKKFFGSTCRSGKRKDH